VSRVVILAVKSRPKDRGNADDLERNRRSHRRRCNAAGFYCR
jgi:hypothetical protein